MSEDIQTLVRLRISERTKASLDGRIGPAAISRIFTA